MVITYKILINLEFIQFDISNVESISSLQKILSLSDGLLNLTKII